MHRLSTPARAVLVLALLAASGCSSSVPTSVTITANDLPNIVLQATDAPEGLVYRVRQSGAENLEKFGRPGEQRTTLASNGFTGAYRVSLSSAAFLDYPSDPRRWTGVDFVENQAVTLNNAGGAQKVLEYYREITTRPDQSPDMEPFEVTDLGEQVYAFRGTIVGVAPAIVLYWRRGNVFSSVTLAGTEAGIDADLALRLARVSDERIAALA